eukprot:RCo014212
MMSSHRPVSGTPSRTPAEPFGGAKIPLRKSSMASGLPIHKGTGSTVDASSSSTTFSTSRRATGARAGSLPGGVSAGSFDETAYWDFIHRPVEPRDLGHTCKQCKRPFRSVGETIAVRRGGRIELRYHMECFSGHADPRSQSQSSATDRWQGHVGPVAPKEPFRKMRTASQF